MSAEPGAREPAPEPLRLVQRFLNTNDREGRLDVFDSPSAAARWFRQAGLRVGRLDERDLARVVALREALRLLLLGNNGVKVEESALETLNAETACTVVGLRFSRTAPQLETRDSGLNRAIGRIVAIVFEAMLEGTWPRLKACRRDVCRWAFYDHSKNRSGVWCTMDICGNRVKTSAYWRRKHGR